MSVREEMERTLRELKASAVIRGAGDSAVYEQIEWLEEQLSEKAE